MYSNWKKIILFVIFFIFISPQKVKAVDITISSFPTSISSNIFTVDTVVTGATNATNYLRVDLYKDGTSNYFGETYNGSDWYSGSDGKSYFPILIQNSSASATLQVQLGNPSFADYSGPGLYKLKIRRYTSSGSQSQNDIQTPVDIQITYSTPSPSPTDTPTNSPTTAPTQAPTSAPTATPTTKPTPTKSPSPKPTLTPTPTESGQTDEPIILEPKVLSLSTIASSSTPEIKKNKKPLVLPIVFVSSGLAFLCYVGYMLYNMKNAKVEEIN